MTTLDSNDMTKVKGTFTDVKWNQTFPIKWAGHFSSDREKGVTIPVQHLPAIDLEINRVYHIKFECLDKSSPPHYINEFVKLHGIHYLPCSNYTKTCPCKKKGHWFALFMNVNNFDVLEYVSPHDFKKKQDEHKR